MKNGLDLPTNGHAEAPRKPILAPRQPIRIPKAAEIVSRELRNRIVRGEIRAGDMLASETELMACFNISRPTLREAIRILEHEGLISISRGARGGARVHAPSEQVATRHISLLLQAGGTTLSDIYRVHMLVEPVAAHQVALTNPAGAGAALRACVQEGRDHFDNDLDFGLAAARFRNTLIAQANIPTLTLLMGMLNHMFEQYWGHLTVTAGKLIDNAPAKRRGLRSLERLIDLIEKGDGPGAEAHWRCHTERVEKTLSRWLPAATVIDLLDQ